MKSRFSCLEYRLSDRIAGVLRHYALRARMFHSGLFCGRHRFDARSQLGHVHLVRRGRIKVRSSGHPPIAIDKPSLLFYPRPLAHGFRTDPLQGADLVCASVDFGAGNGNPLAQALPAVLCIPLEQMPGVGATLELIFAEAFGAACGREAAIDRLMAARPRCRAPSGHRWVCRRPSGFRGAGADIWSHRKAPVRVGKAKTPIRTRVGSPARRRPPAHGRIIGG
jgi:hypothetical protein